ncbi:nucleoid-associated protein [Catenovulum sp. SM1970]|uniref:nucleoid-associated protein n=1 Tax=Marinifaba aquimaris TaxID=2741323 RepID=UPI00157266FB|nr:nucleoid-associated protein [Marinifaba aquimaris]NTS78714.1 nucleoid-associated protein [Marinifaba aquimaris]
MSVTNAQIYFNRLVIGEEAINLQLEQASCVEGQTADYLAESMHQSFTKKGQKAYCCFKDESATKQLLVDGTDQKSLANTLIDKIQQAIEVEAPPAETIMAVACYRYLASDFILITLLGVKDSVQLSDNISPERSKYLDVANIQLAIQLDMSELLNDIDSARGIAYIKGRVGRTVSDFMSDALEIEPRLNAKEATQKLIATVEDFISDEVEDKQASQTVREVTLEVMKNASDAGEFLEMQTLSDEIEEKTGIAGLYDKAAEEEDFNDTCPVYMSASKSLQKIFGQGGGMSISFNRKLLGEHVHFDKISKKLTFSKLPPNLLDALEKCED